MIKHLRQNCKKDENNASANKLGVRAARGSSRPFFSPTATEVPAAFLGTELQKYFAKQHFDCVPAAAAVTR